MKKKKQNKTRFSKPMDSGGKKPEFSKMFLLKLIRIPGYTMNLMNRIVREVYEETLANFIYVTGILKIEEKYFI